MLTLEIADVTVQKIIHYFLYLKEFCVCEVCQSLEGWLASEGYALFFMAVYTQNMILLFL